MKIDKREATGVDLKGVTAPEGARTEAIVERLAKEVIKGVSLKHVLGLGSRESLPTTKLYTIFDKKCLPCPFSSDGEVTTIETDIAREVLKGIHKHEFRGRSRITGDELRACVEGIRELVKLNLLQVSSEDVLKVPFGALPHTNAFLSRTPLGNAFLWDRG